MSTRRDRTQTREPVTLQDIAEQIGVHKSTVQRALSGAGRISGPTTERIRSVANELGYDPGQQQAARSLAYRKHGKVAINRMIALFFPPGFFRVRYFLRLYQGILDVLVPAKYDLLTTYFEAPNADTMPNSLLRGDVDGALALASTQSVRSLLEELGRMPAFRSRPFLSLVNPVPGATTVSTDFAAGAHAAVSHLLALGHRKILHFHEKRPTEEQIAGRLVGFKRACEEHGVAPSGVMLNEPLDDKVPGPDRMSVAIARAFDRDSDITAILTPNDPNALQAADALRQMGKKIPRDVSLVGYDDTDELLDQQRRNMLTTVRVPLEEIGREAASLLIRQITGEAARDQQIVLSSSLVVRNSTAPPRDVKKKSGK